MGGTILRVENGGDFTALYDFIQEAFKTAAVSDGTEQDFTNRLRAGGGYVPELAMVAEQDGKIVGHVMLTRVLSNRPVEKESVLLLAPLSVQKEYRNQGIGRLLVSSVLERAAASGFKAVVLAGDPKYYGRFGFQRADRWNLFYPSVSVEYFLALELEEGALNNYAGAVQARLSV